jgi:uncharacterized membrane protein
LVPTLRLRRRLCFTFEVILLAWDVGL